MSDEKQYKGVVGFVFKEPEHSSTRTGKDLRRLVVVECNTRNEFFGVTVWDEQHGDVEIHEGDLVAANGVYTEDRKDDRTYKSISAKYFLNMGSGAGADDGYQGGGQSSGSRQQPQEDPFLWLDSRIFGGEHCHH